MRSWSRFAAVALPAITSLALLGCGGSSGSSGSFTPASYTIGGSISGLTAAGLVLEDNGGDKLTVSSGASSFTFATAISTGSPYSVSILTQPAGLGCTVTGGSGTATAKVTGVSIACVPALTIGGSIFGLGAAGLVLEDNGGNTLTIAAGATSYAFIIPGAIPAGGTPYTITALSNPSGQECTVANPEGTATASVGNVNIACSTLPPVTYTISGTVTGLKGPGLVLEDGLGINNDDLVPVSADGSFSFVNPVASGAAYNVSILNQPGGRNCGVTHGSGTATANITNVTVICLGEWTWIDGSSTVPPYAGQPGIYGTLGTPSPTNVPGGREQSLVWKGANGVAYLFGGYGEDSTGVGYGGQLNDLWRFDPTLGNGGEWTWIGGSTITPASTTLGAAGQSGIYGTLGTPGPNNIPGGREQVLSWVDASGKLWMFGGEGNDAYGVTGELNDLWTYDPTLGTEGEWTWVGGGQTVGSPFAGQPGVYGTLGTPAPANLPGGRYGAITWVDSTGNFWLFGGNGIDESGAEGELNDLWKFTPSTGQWTWMAGPSLVGSNAGQPGVYGTLGTPAATNIPGGRDAAVSWSDKAGNIWLFGGIGFDSAGNQGYLNDLWKYTPGTNASAGEWTWMGGSDTAPPNAGQPGVYGSLGVPASSNIPGGRFSAVSWTDPSGNLWLFSGQGYDSVSLGGYLNDLWVYTPGANASAGQWTWVGGDTSVGRSGGQIGVYATQGVLSTGSPGGRFGGASWTDSTGHLWLFGGMGYDATGNQGYLNDLWNYQP